MSRHWTERLDTEKHRDYFGGQSLEGETPISPRDNLLESPVYFVEVCTFTFQFHSLENIRSCLSYFQTKIHPSDMEANITLEHYWQPWYQRLPQRLFEEAKRKKVIRAFERALIDFTAIDRKRPD